MFQSKSAQFLSYCLLPLSLTQITPAIAQITPVNDGTGTIVNQQGNQFAIDGGSLSGDGANLFHNFTDFNLSNTQTATFLGDATLQNIFSKISGGNPSYIDGLLQGSGHNANLFLLNDAGIVFGTNARLDLSGDFTASTASNLGFDNDQWLNSGNYTDLLGNPTIFGFSNASAIINAANLEVNTGRSLNLFAGNVVNTGTLTAEQGNIQLIAVPNTNHLRLNQTGQILGLELPIATDTFSLVDLPALLTGTSFDTGLTLTNNTVQLAANDTEIPQTSGSLFVNNQLDTTGVLGGNLSLFGSAIALNKATINTSGHNGGGNILIGGAFQGQGDLPRALTTAIDVNSFLTANAIDTGNAGDIIVWSDQRTNFDGFLAATGGVNGGDAGLAEISSKGLLDLAPGWSQRITLTAPNGNSGTLLLDPTDIRIVDDASGLTLPFNSSPIDPPASILFDADIISFLDGEPEIRDPQNLVITTASSGTDQGNITFDENTNIAWTSGSHLTLIADNNILINPNVTLTNNNTGSLFLQAGGAITSASNIGLNSGNLNIVATGDLNLQDIFTLGANQGGPGGNIFVQSATGSLTVGAVTSTITIAPPIPETPIPNTASGNVELLAQNNITTGQILTRASDANAGHVLIRSTTGAITTREIQTAAFNSTAGNVTLEAIENITVDSIDASSLGGNGGNIDIKTQGFFRAIATALDSFVVIEASLDTTSHSLGLPPDGSVMLPPDDVVEEEMPIGDDFMLVSDGDFPVGSGESPEETPITGMGGTIRIEHGGNGTVPFVVGNATTNGTAGKIISDGATDAATANEINPTVSLSETFVQNDIAIITTVPEPPAPPVEPPAPIITPPVESPVTPVEPPATPPTTPVTSTPPTTTPAVPPPEAEPNDCFPNCAQEQEEEAQTNRLDEVARAQAASEEEVNGENPLPTMKYVNEVTGKEPAIVYVYTETASNVAEANTKQGETKTTVKTADGEEIIQWEFSGDRLTDYLNTATQNYLNPRISLDSEAVLNVVLVTADGTAIRRQVDGITRRELLKQTQSFARGITSPRTGNAYLKPAQYLYDVIVRPVEDLLGDKNIDNLNFILDDGLRTLPIAALHDGDQFLVEKYSLGLMPSFSLTNTSDYVAPRDNQLLAFAASKFDDQNDLPAAPFEVDVITQEIWQGRTSRFLEQQFTVENLIQARQKQNYGIVHLATHGEFTGAGPDASYIQFQDQRVNLNELDRLGLGDPPIELLVLSACRTALGDRRAELGFAGLAVNSGAKSVIGSLWYVDDVGTMGLMVKLYDSLQQARTKSDALRNAQLALLNNDVEIENSQLKVGDRLIPLPPDLQNVSNADFSHPYYWSGFTLVGNPW